MQTHSKGASRMMRFCLATLLLVGISGTLLAACRNDEAVTAESQNARQTAQNMGRLANRFARAILRFFPDRISNLQRWAYTGNPMASQQEYLEAVEGARRILFQPWSFRIPGVGDVTVPQWQGIYFYVAHHVHISRQNVADLAQAVARAPQVSVLAGATAASTSVTALSIDQIRNKLATAIGNMNNADKAALLVAAVSGSIEVMVFGGVDRGSSARESGAPYWGIILAAELGPAGIGHEFVFDASGNMSHMNVVFAGPQNSQGSGAGGFYGWGGGHRELGFYLQPAAGIPVGMFAVLNADSLPGRLRDFLNSAHEEEHTSPAPSAPSARTSSSGETAAQAAARLRCDRNTTLGGSWSGCVHFLRWRAQATNRTVNARLDASHFHAAVEGCMRSSQGDQRDTCTARWLHCASTQWAADNFACLASNGGHSCISQCR